MMLHRHFEEQNKENITTTADLNETKEFVSNIFSEEKNEDQPKRGRRKKSED